MPSYINMDVLGQTGTKQVHFHTANGNTLTERLLHKIWNTWLTLPWQLERDIVIVCPW